MTANVTMKLRAEPVVLQAAVEHDFERAQERRDQHEADDIEPYALACSCLPLLDCADFGSWTSAIDQREREHADRAR